MVPAPAGWGRRVGLAGGRSPGHGDSLIRVATPSGASHAVLGPGRTRPSRAAEAAATWDLVRRAAQRSRSRSGDRRLKARRFELGFEAAAKVIGGRAAPGSRLPARAWRCRMRSITCSAGRRQVWPRSSVSMCHMSTWMSHNHWHFQGFARYELRATWRMQARARSDRRAPASSAAIPLDPQRRQLPANFTHVPDPGRPIAWWPVGHARWVASSHGNLGRLRRPPTATFLEGQYIDITGLPCGALHARAHRGPGRHPHSGRADDRRASVAHHDAAYR